MRFEGGLKIYSGVVIKEGLLVQNVATTDIICRNPLDVALHLLT